jgi:hypothetical protein
VTEGTLVNVHLTDFVLNGRFGPFRPHMTRREVIQMLGPADDGYYPRDIGYGPLIFLTAGSDAVLGIQLTFPHESLCVCPNGEWAHSWRSPSWLSDWPGRRLNWILPPFVEHATIGQIATALPTLAELEPVEAIQTSAARSVTIYVRSSGTHLLFESVRPGEEPTLHTMWAGARWAINS